ncbi:MAG: cupin domain-containing protein [Rhodobacteraceae bacterium]|nr:cupin domain-containing protein [Paracoccaceae bacterium]
MTSPIVRLAEVETFNSTPGNSQRFGADLAPLGPQLKLDGIGCMYIEVEPGKRAFPFHSHLGNDELFVVLEGTGVYRYGDQEYEIAAGDLCAAPRGGPGTAHQIINRGADKLKYLAISTKQDPDICEYPDSDKFAAIAIRPGPDFANAHMRFVGRAESAVSYFDGEEF